MALRYSQHGEPLVQQEYQLVPCRNVSSHIFDFSRKARNLGFSVKCPYFKLQA